MTVRYFSAVYSHAGKADICECCLNPKRKLGVTKHLPDITKFQTKLNAINVILKVLSELLVALFSLGNWPLTLIQSSWVQIAPSSANQIFLTGLASPGNYEPEILT